MRQAFVLLTAALLSLGGLGLAVGCASSGQDQNYKLLQEDRPLFDTRPDPSRPGESRVPASPVSQKQLLAALEPQAPAQAELQNTPATQPREDAQTSSAVRQALAVPGVEPSVIGLDRANWPTVTVTPAPVQGPDTHGSADSITKPTSENCCADDQPSCCAKPDDNAAKQAAEQACCAPKPTCCQAPKADCCKPGAPCCEAKAACCDKTSENACCVKEHAKPVEAK